MESLSINFSASTIKKKLKTSSMQLEMKNSIEYNLNCKIILFNHHLVRMVLINHQPWKPFLFPNELFQLVHIHDLQQTSNQ